MGGSWWEEAGGRAWGEGEGVGGRILVKQIDHDTYLVWLPVPDVKGRLFEVVHRLLRQGVLWEEKEEENSW